MTEPVCSHTPDQPATVDEDVAFGPAINPWALVGWAVLSLACWYLIAAALVAVVHGRIP